MAVYEVTVDDLVQHAEQINRCHGLDPRHKLLIQSVREIAKMYAVLDAQLEMTVARLGGTVEGLPTTRINFLQRVDGLVNYEKEWYESQ